MRDPDVENAPSTLIFTKLLIKHEPGEHLRLIVAFRKFGLIIDCVISVYVNGIFAFYFGGLQ